MAKTPAVLLDPATFDGPSTDDPGTPDAQVTIRGRNVEVPEHFANRINAKLAKIEKISPSNIQRFDVILLHENNPRLSKVSQRIEITDSGRLRQRRAQLLRLLAEVLVEVRACGHRNTRIVCDLLALLNVVA